MKLATFRTSNDPTPRAAQVIGNTLVEYTAGSTIDHLVSQDQADGQEHKLESVTLLAPLDPRAIFGIGLNYADHAAETGRDAPDTPIVFMKLPSSSTAPNEPVAVPAAAAARLDYEGELAIVIGADGGIGGYAIADDLSARDLQGREPQWTRAKGFDHACPWGPWITTADEIADPRALSLRTWVNGGLRQDGTTKDLIFGPQELVDFIGETCRLAPGDLILTGTPAGVGVAMDPRQFLAAGDVVRIAIEQLGAIEHAIA